MPKVDVDQFLRTMEDGSIIQAFDQLPSSFGIKPCCRILCVRINSLYGVHDGWTPEKARQKFTSLGGHDAWIARRKISTKQKEGRQKHKEKNECQQKLQTLEYDNKLDMLKNELEDTRTMKDRAVGVVQELKRRLNDGDDNDPLFGICVICLDKKVGVNISPCNHLCMCKDCEQALHVKKCPMCRIAYTKTEVIYL